MVNPFDSKVAASPRFALDSDVQDIHKDAFNRVLRLLARVREQQRSQSALIHGEPGSGKTHLVARIRNHLQSHDPKAVFVYLSMSRSPLTLARDVLNEVARELMSRGPSNRTRLEEIIRNRIRETNGSADGERWLEWFDSERPRSEQASVQLVERLEQFDERFDLGFNLRKALEHVALGNHTADIRNWLRREPLPEKVLERLDIRAEEDDRDGESIAQDRLLALGRLAGTEFPFVYCFDQLEALRTHANDDQGLFAFGQLCNRLVEHTQGNLVVSCIQSSFLVSSGSGLSKLPGVRESDMARVAGDRLSLPPLDWPQAQQLVIARLDSQPSVREQRLGKSGLWPLEEKALARLVESNRCTPRDLIALCREEFDRRVDGKTGESETLDAALEREFGERVDAIQATSDADTTQTLLHGLPMLSDCIGAGRMRANPEDRDVELTMVDGGATVGISVCNQKHKSLTTRLDRLRKRVEDKDFDRVVISRDADLTIPATSKKALQYWNELAIRKDRVSELRPTPQALVALEALRRLLSDARSGDLDVAGKTVDVESLKSWLVANMPGQLKELWNDLAPTDRPTGSDKSADDALREKCVWVAQQCRLLPMTELAEKAEADLAVVERIVNANPDLFGVLHGPPVVLFDRTGQPAPAGAANLY